MFILALSRRDGARSGRGAARTPAFQGPAAFQSAPQADGRPVPPPGVPYGRRGEGLAQGCRASTRNRGTAPLCAAVRACRAFTDILSRTYADIARPMWPAPPQVRAVIGITAAVESVSEKVLYLAVAAAQEGEPWQSRQKVRDAEPPAPWGARTRWGPLRAHASMLCPPCGFNRPPTGVYPFFIKRCIASAGMWSHQPTPVAAGSRLRSLVAARAAP